MSEILPYGSEMSSLAWPIQNWMMPFGTRVVVEVSIPELADLSHQVWCTWIRHLRAFPKKIKKKCEGCCSTSSHGADAISDNSALGEYLTTTIALYRILPQPPFVATSHRSGRPKIRCKSAENRLPFHARPTRRTSDNPTNYFLRANAFSA